MARLRFPGRPGCRFDRMGIRYGADDAKNVKDPTLVLVASIHRGLRLFRELFGESDEEEDFEGFTPKDVQKSEKKLKAMLALCEDSPEKIVPSSKPASSRIAKAKVNLTATDRGRGVRKSYTELLKHGIVKPSKPSLLKQAREETQKTLKIKFKIKKEKSGLEGSPKLSRKSLDKKSVKFDLTPKGQGKGKSIEKGSKKMAVVPVKQKKGKKCLERTEEETPRYAKKKVKEKDKLSSVKGSKGVKGQQNLAKQLLQKARKGQQTVKVQGKVKSPIMSPKSPKNQAYPRKQFVLPTQSSRSSRVIIPNKRFLEQDDFNQIMTKRTRMEESALSPKSETSAATSPRSRVQERLKVKTEQLKSPQLTSLSPGPAVPHIPPGQLTSLSPGPTVPHVPPGHLFDPMEGQTLSLYDQPLIIEGKRARKPSLKVRIKLTDERIQAFQVKSFEKKLEARKTIEAEKAQTSELKRVHLTPSKLAGAVTSKLPTSPIFAPPKFGVSGRSALSERQRLEALEKEALATRRKGHNILRKAKLQLSRSALNRSKADFARTLKKEIKMEAKLEKMRLKQGSAVGGFSKMSGYSTFAGVAKSYMDAKDEPLGAGDHGEELGLSGRARAGVVCAVCKDSNLPPLRRRNYYGVPCCDGCRRFYRVHMKRAKEKDFFCNGNCSTDIRRCVFCRYLRCQEVFPAEDKLKPLKESPTKKLIQGDSAEEGLMSPPGQTEDGSEEGVSAAGPLPSSPESVASSPASEGRGPRIKHVCRKAAVVLGKPVAKFPQTSLQSSSEITLSALPRGEKVKLWKKEEETKAELSDDERTLDEIIQQSEDNVCTVKRSPHKSPALGRLVPGSRGRLTVRRRKLRCKKCPGCLAKDCGKCLHCQDKPKFGGRGVMKQACVDRKCAFPRYSRAATAAFIKPKDLPPDSESCEQGCDMLVDSSEQCDPSQNTMGCSSINPNTKNGNGTSSSMNLIRRMVLHSQGNARPEAGVKHSGDSESGIRTPANISRQLLPHFSGGLSRENLSQKSGRQSPLVPPYRSGDPSKKSGLSVLSPKKLPKGKDRNLTVLRSEQCVLQPLPSTMRHWAGFGSQCGYRIKAEYKENYDIYKAWQMGVPLTMSGPLCVRTACYLCGSAGKHEFVFCNVCCEPFHEFCLEEDERPTEDNWENWCCHRCQFCHVCGEQYNLLRCDKCQNTYHPECLGPNYPTKPSKKKKIWVCTKCVRCKSCGSTTPGNAGHATWTYDFQLCYECGKLMDKGNFCPLCHKCYSDDDWESKMVQCVSCDSWVHAKCEGLNDEMYERVSFLPEDVHYICKMCSPGDRPRHWELVLRDDLQAGIKSVFYTLLSAKCAQHLLHIDVKEEPVEKEEVSKGGSSSAGTAVTECNKEQSSLEGVRDCDRTANYENKVSKELAESKSEGGKSNDPTSRKEGASMCNTERTLVSMETDKDDVTPITDLKCDSNSLGRAIGKETDLDKGRGILLKGGARVGLGNEANCDIKTGEDSLAEKPVPWTVGGSGDGEGHECDVPMEVDEPSKTEGTASENESGGGKNILGIATVNSLQGSSETDFKNKLMGGSVIDETASQKESEGSCNDDGIALQNKLKADTQGSITDHKDEVDGGQSSGQVGDKEQVCSHPMVDQSQSIKLTEPCLSSDKDQSAPEKSKSIVQSEIISITDNDSNQMEVEGESVLNSDQSNSIIQDCKVECDQSDSSLQLKSAQSEDISKVEVKTEESRSETASNIDNNNSLDFKSEDTKCETSQSEDTKCETSQSEDTKCETSQSEDTKCETSQSEDTKCETSQSEDTKCETSQSEDTKCETSQSEDTKCETSQSEDTKCETSQSEDTKCETSQSEDTKCETSQSEDTKCETSQSEDTKCETSQSEDTKRETSQSKDTKCEASRPEDTKCESPEKEKDTRCETKSDELKCETPKDNQVCKTKCETPEKLKFSPITDISLITPKKSGSTTSVHVRFNDKSGIFRKAAPSRDYPLDFNAVKAKMAADKYNNVEEFSEDMAHIISQALNDSTDQRIVRKKNNNSVRSMFAKQMERCFPWFNIKTCKLWNEQQNLPGGMLPDAVIPPSEDHTYAQWLERQDMPRSPQPSPFKKLHSTPIRKALPMAVDEDAEKVLSCDLEDSGEDMRRCILCWHYGDADPNDAGRLLYSGQDDWIHINCALWSAEAYEEELDGSLQYVHAAVSRGKLLKCDRCNRSGATVGCCMRGCPANYHFMCARHSNCVFQEDKKVFCSLHLDKVDGDLVAMDRFAVNRRVLVNMEGVKWAKKTWAKGLDPGVINVLIGSCTVESLGRLILSSDYRDCLAPAEFSSSRVFWSTKDARRRCVYNCRIVEVKPDSPKSMKVVLKDMTIIHDTSHPDYVPLSTLDIPGVNLFPDTESHSNNNNNSLKSDVIDLSGDSYEMDGLVTYQSASFQGQGLSSSYNGNSSFAAESDSQTDKLSSSWPLVKKKSSKVDLTVLSPKTLKLLNIKDPELYKRDSVPVPEKPALIQAPPSVTENKFSGFLTKIADRLNQAAARNRNINRKDGEKNTPSSAVRGRSRSNSVERMLSSRSNSVERFVPSPLSRERSKSVERFVTSPLPFSRSRSNSTEREYLAGSSVTLPESNSEPVNDMETSQTKDPDTDGNATFSTVSAEESMDQSGMTTDSSLEPIAEEGNLNAENIRETVIVLPEDCGELTEEEVIAIAQAALQQQEGVENLELQDAEETCNQTEDQLEENSGEYNVVKQGDTSESQQLKDSNKEETETIDDPLGPITTDDCCDTRETSMEYSADKTKTVSPGEITTDYSGEVRVTVEKPQEETALKNSVEIQENTMDHFGDSREITQEDRISEATETNSTTETDTQIQTSAGNKTGGQHGTTIFDSTDDSTDELEAASNVDINDVILIDITKSKPESEEKNNLGPEQELGVKRSDGLYLCSSSGMLLDNCTVESSTDKRLSGSVCNEDSTESVSEKCLNESVSNKSLNELVPVENLSESVSKKGLTDSVSKERIDESISNEILAESMSNERLPKVQSVGPMETQDQMHTDEDNVSFNDRCPSALDQRLTKEESLVDTTGQVPDVVRESLPGISHAIAEETMLTNQHASDSEETMLTNQHTANNEETMLTNRHTANNEETMLTNQNAADSEGWNRDHMLSGKDESVKRGNNIEITAIDLTGDDLDDDSNKMTNEPATKSDECDRITRREEIRKTDLSRRNNSQIIGKEPDSQIVVRTEPLHFLRPIEEKPLKKKISHKKSPTRKLKYGKSNKDVPKDAKSRSETGVRVETDDQDGADTSRATPKVVEDKISGTDHENSEHEMISNTIHLNILTKSVSDDDEQQGAVESDTIRELAPSPVDQVDKTTEKDLTQRIPLSDHTQSAEIVEPIYNTRNELIGHRVMVAGDSDSPSDLATPDSDRRTSPTPDSDRRTSPTTDLWNMVVKELVSENPEKFQPIQTDVSQSMGPQDTVSVDDVNRGDKEGVNCKNVDEIPADDRDPRGDMGDHSVKDQGEGQISGARKLQSLSESLEAAQGGDNSEERAAEMVTDIVKEDDKPCITDDQSPVKPVQPSPVIAENMDKSPVNKTPVKVNTEEEKRLEKEKTEILKGLGLARTPTGNEEISSPDFSNKSSPLKKYPLRHRRSNSGHSDESPVKAEIDWWSDQKLPIHMEIAQKIKAESLSKSIPGAKGPFKCPTCRRLYRTRESFKTHVKFCDFEVSTSDDEEEEEEEEKDEEAKDGRRRYSVREHTMEARKAMAGEMRALEVLQNREASPNKKRGRPKRSLYDDSKDCTSSNHISSPITDDGTPPVKRGRGRPKMSPNIVMSDKEKDHSQKNNTDSVTGHSQDGATNTPETGASKGKRGRPPKLKSPDRGKSPINREGNDIVTPVAQGTSSEREGTEGIRKRGRPSLKSSKTQPDKEDVGKATGERSPLKTLTPTKIDIVRKRGRPSLTFSPKEDHSEEEIVPRKRERLSGGGLKSPPLRSPSRGLMGVPRGRGRPSPITGLVGSPRGRGRPSTITGLVGSPGGRGRPPKTNPLSVKMESTEESIQTRHTERHSTEDGVPVEKAEQQEVNMHSGNVSPIRRRGRPAKILRSPKKIENDEKASEELPSVFEIFAPVEGNVSVSVTSPEGIVNVGKSFTSPEVTGNTSDSFTSPGVKRKRGRPFKNKKIQGREPIKRDENNKLHQRSKSAMTAAEMNKESPEVKGRKSDLKVRDGLYTESGRPSRRSASLALQKFEDNFGADTDNALGNEEDGDQVGEKVSGTGSNTRRKQHIVVRKDSEEEHVESKGNNSLSESTSKQNDNVSCRTSQREEGNHIVRDSDYHKVGSSALSAIVIDSENEEEEEQMKEQGAQTTEHVQHVRKDGQSSSSCTERKDAAVSESEPNDIATTVCSPEKDNKKQREVLSQSNLVNTTATVQQAESHSKHTSITMVGAGVSKGMQEISGPSSSCSTSATTGSNSQSRVKMTSTFGVQTEEEEEEDEQDFQQELSPQRRCNPSSEPIIRIKIQQPHSSSTAGIGDNMVHPTTPVSIRNLLQQKIAGAQAATPGYQVVKIQRPKSADTLKDDIRSILPVLPPNILEQLRDPLLRFEAVKMIQNLIKVKSASDAVKSITQPTVETQNVLDNITPIPKFTLPSNLSTREAIQKYIKSHVSQRNKESGVEQPQQSNMVVTTRPLAQEAMSGPSYHMVSPSVSDPRLLSPAAMTTGFQVMTPTHNSLGGTVLQVPSNLPYQLSPPQSLPQLSPQLPMATHSMSHLPQLAPRMQVNTQSSVTRLLQSSASPQYIGEMSGIQQLQNFQSSQLPPFNIGPSSVNLSQQPLPPFNIAASPQSVLSVTTTPTPMGQRAVLMGPPMGAYNIPQVSGLRPQEGVSSLPGTVMIPQNIPIASQTFSTSQMASNTNQLSELMPGSTGNSGSTQLTGVTGVTGEEVVKRNTNTLVRIFVDGKPVAVTTDPSVLNNRDKLLSRLGSTNLQAGTYSITVSTHKMSIGTNTLTMAGQSSTPSPLSMGSRCNDSRVLQSILKAPPASSLGTPIYSAVTTSTVGSTSSIMSTGAVSPVSDSVIYQQEQEISKMLSKKELTAVSNLHSYVKNTDGKVRRPMVKPNIIHKKRVAGTSSLSKKMLVTMEKNGVIQGALAKALMRKLVKTNNEISPKKKIVFRGLHSPAKVLTEKSESTDISPVREEKASKQTTGVMKIRRVNATNKIKINTIKKGIRRRKTPLKPRSVALPHVTGVMSHPILHAQKDLLTLPQPEIEEEVIATPYSKASEPHGRGPAHDTARSKNDPYLVFEINSDDGFSCRADSMDEAWRQVAERVQDARVAAHMKQLSFQSMSGVTMFGVNHNSLRYLIEQLNGVQHFRNYETLYHHYDLSPEELEPAENPTGSIRTEGYHGRKPFDMFSFLMSMYRRKPNPVPAGKSDVEMNLKSQRRATSMDLPMAMRFRKLKEHSREAVGVYRSLIHGRGLFCKRNIDGGEMIIEYAGEVIRSSLTDKREKYYESKGIGCYMFRIDDMDVVDATMRGSAARFINHSCEPNCYSKVIQVDGKKHIVIFASRAIKRSEELTYDYKFPIEEVKIPCTCGQKRCRKYLN
ncbi:uncharacterized protein LOC110462400 isoform X2 [Mizuhopecten yessoensis]|uniref:Histone-lysine N-methyltransferase 2A n=1 Tax=Mizuhopecten yessoensis TaxID=6573 RepID=A0A210PY69_MIZYE|nr:uncharacterized protein LOC110462400 isoform X2 [Mizuhopecten yessoensis]OWF41440.1 Histone-lysine N-methyltransferase 2A [Mizuhopecten yessoensis]